MTFGLNIERKPSLIVERHQTASWGWRWSCAVCGKANTRIADEGVARDEAHKHACDRRAAGRENPYLTIAPQLTVWSSWQWGERRRHEHY